MKHNHDDLEELLEKIDIESYLDREGIDYKVRSGRSGTQLNLKECPYCGGDGWKVYLNADTGLGNCFSGSCDKKTFNKYSFIQGHTGLGGKALREHLRSVATEFGWRPPRKAVVAVHTDVKELKLPPTLPLPIKGRNLSYLQNRGIDLDACKYFHLSFCREGYFGMRVIIPIFDLEGNLVSFQGRDITGSADEKYLFPAGFASTGEHLYNGHNVFKTDHIVVCEGVFDVIATKLALDRDPELRDIVPIGTFGMALSVPQLDKFQILQRRGVKTITMMWDGEVAATKHAVAAGIQLKGLGFHVRLAMLPPGEDPNSIPPNIVRDSYYAAKSLDKVAAVQIIMERIRQNKVAGLTK
ncbi:hypothetical protein LJC19_04725 [Oxalobacter sp. OttesenSCG-928-P03]|nr:hypothetical protein [Oxalobacter sp. OttesenSCG-928-P03]